MACPVQVDNCSYTARLGSRKWAPRFDYIFDQQARHFTMQLLKAAWGMCRAPCQCACQLTFRVLEHPLSQAVSPLQAYTAIDEGQQLDEEAFQQFQRDPVHQVSLTALLKYGTPNHACTAPTHLDDSVLAFDH